MQEDFFAPLKIALGARFDTAIVCSSCYLPEIIFYTCFIECTQLRILCKDDVPGLLHQALPSQWSQGETVSWYPNDKNQNHPPERWIRLVWRYLRENFHSAEDVQCFGDLPLLPVNLAQTPITLTRLCYPSRVIFKCLFDDAIDDHLDRKSVV